MAEVWSTGNYDPSANGEQPLSAEFRKVFGIEVEDNENGQSPATERHPFQTAIDQAKQSATFDNGFGDLVDIGIPDIGIPDIGIPVDP